MRAVTLPPTFPIAVAVLTLTAVALPAVADDGSSSAADVAMLSSGLASFSLDLHRALAAGGGDRIGSPFGAAIMMGMIRCGSAGETDAGIARALRCPLDVGRFHTAFRALRDGVGESLRSADARLSVAKSLVGPRGLVARPDFVAALSNHYAATWATLDFSRPAEAARILNQWVAHRTRNRVTDLYAPASFQPDTQLVATGVFCFEADWADPFPAIATQDRPFHRADGTTVDVAMMRAVRSDVAVASADGAVFARLPYRGGNVAMLVALPARIADLALLEASLTAQRWEAWRAALRAAPVDPVEILLPKFSAEQSRDLGGPIAAMGAEDLFSRSKADLRWMTDAKVPPYLAALVERAGIRVDEKGTEAWSAIRGEFIAMGGTPPPPPPRRVFRVDRPFLYAVYEERHGTILFMGRITLERTPVAPSRP